MTEKISNWRTKIMGKPVPIKLPRSVDELPGIRERGAHAYDFLNHTLPDIGAVHEHVVLRPDGAGRQTPTAEIYVPKGDGPFPVVMHLHGGAWFTGNARGDRKFGMTLAAAGFVVVNVDYALAPEHPFPCAVEDTIYAARWIVRNIARYKGDPARLAIGGASAGGNLAASACLALHGVESTFDGADLAGVPVRVSALVLEFAVLDVARWLYDPGYAAGATEISIGAYLGPNFTTLLNEPFVSPLMSPDLDKLPPTYLTCGDQDALLSNTLLMTAALVKRGVPTTASVLAGVDHEFLKIPDKVPNGEAEVRRMIDWLHEQLDRAAS
ncbi:alpha/beta hydrolase [Reyranella sp. CPCC 100927]|uniref:alpha/beta hydrolase n=1 Tax=Reyranella sp. CPCC 100927 TaxID=2599616 RepID=UPI0011B6AD4F|nr:alpha/beta hydrolase [Reyranella sp. CPCC 100927]TWT08687.1 alpha/beta hydrolase [Reyranella sp. CPCC 100927]